MLIFTRYLRWSDGNRTPHTILKQKNAESTPLFSFLFLVWGGVPINHYCM
jgi:hypothetical protein